MSYRLTAVGLVLVMVMGGACGRVTGEVPPARDPNGSPGAAAAASTGPGTAGAPTGHGSCDPSAVAEFDPESGYRASRDWNGVLSPVDSSRTARRARVFYDLLPGSHVVFRAEPIGDLIMSLRSPTGDLLEADGHGDGWWFSQTDDEVEFRVADPRPGIWEVVFEIPHQAAPIPTELYVYLQPPVNEPPIAEMVISISGSTVTFDASSSHDPDGDVVAYLWDFGDGCLATGERVMHGFPEGTFFVVLIAKDDGGELGWGNAEELIVVREGEITTAPTPEPGDVELSDA